MFQLKPTPMGYADLEAVTGPHGRTYTTPDGKNYPSITTILGKFGKEGLDKWRERVGDAEADRIGRVAALRGQRLHEAVESYLNGIEPTLSDMLVRSTFNQVKPLLDKNLTKVYGIEVSLYSDYLGVAGRVDLAGVWDGVNSIIDIKSSAREKTAEWIENYFLQETFYSIAWEERTGQPMPQLVTLIGCDETPKAQVFIEKRDTWAPKLLETIKVYKETYT
jgi:genome maintenance exonuclease 1